MDLLKYISISTFEYLSLFVFILVQFRFSIKENISPIALISILLSFVSYTFTNSGFGGLFPIVQFLIVLLYFQLVMKVNIFNAMIMYFTGYIVIGLVQTCILTAAMHLEFVTGNAKAGTNTAYAFQLITIVIMLIFSLLIVYFKGGFSFIEARSRFTSRSFTGKNRIFIGFISIAFIVTAVGNIMLVEYENPPLLFLASTFLVVLLLLFYLSIKKDENLD